MAEAAFKLAGFELLEKLGHGASGVVWKARQISLDRLVAIKVIPAEKIRSEEDVRLTLQESRTAAKLKHPGIVQIYDACEQNGTYFLVMEYVAGYNIGQWLARRERLPVKDVLLIAEAVAGALDYAWSATGLIHCDIKPENIMVDQDGTMKVADLGLSLTRETKDAVNADEIAGTPGYISPEQVRGDFPLDCRTDIYALGATLYHLLTGHRPFAECTDEQAMENHLTAQIPDPRDTVQTIPACVCALLERMLVKDRNQRSADWKQVLADLRRVSKGLMPLSAAPEPGSSTMVFRKTVANHVKAARPTGDNRRGVRWMPVVALLLLALAAGYWWFNQDKPLAEFWSGWKQRVVNWWSTQPQPDALPNNGMAPDDTAARPKMSLSEADAMLEEVLEWSKSHRDQYEACVGRYQIVIDRFPESTAARMALDEIRRIRERHARQLAENLQEFKDRVGLLMKEGKLQEALVFVENYTGIGAAESASNRLDIARGLRRQIAEREMSRIEDEKWDSFLGKVAELLALGRVKDAQDAIHAAMKVRANDRHRGELDALSNLILEASQTSGRIRQSFEADIGKVITVSVGRAQMRMHITGISGQKVVARLVDSGAEYLFQPDDMPAEERLRRFGEATTPGLALAKGILAAGVRQYTLAEDMFGRVGPLLSEPLLAQLKLIQSGMNDEQVAAALTRVLASGGISVGAYNQEDWIKAIEQAKVPRDRALVMNAQREMFLDLMGISAFAVRAAPVLLALERQCQLWMESSPHQSDPSSSGDRVEKTPEDMIDAAKLSFRERNPGLAPEAITTYPVGGGVGVRVVSDSIVDLSALARCSVVKGVWIETVKGSDLKLDVRPLTRSNIVDLRMKGYVPRDSGFLRGIALKSLTLAGAGPASVAGLEGLPLSELDLTGCSITDLGVVRGMKLEKLIIDGTKVTGLAPLSGMLLRELSCRGTPVRDISALRGLPLTVLDLSQTAVSNFGMLNGLKLVSLDVSRTGVRDIAFCADMPLECLSACDTAVDDVSCLKGKDLKRLVLSRTAVRDITPLSGSRIDTLNISGTRVPPAILARVLPTLKLRELALDDVDIGGLDFLKGQRLTRLSIKGTRVNNIAFLEGMPLRILDLRGIRLTDTSVLESLKLLEAVWAELDPLQARVLFERNPALVTINGFTREAAAKW